MCGVVVCCDWSNRKVGVRITQPHYTNLQIIIPQLISDQSNYNLDNHFQTLVWTNYPKISLISWETRRHPHNDLLYRLPLYYESTHTTTPTTGHRATPIPTNRSTPTPLNQSHSLPGAIVELAMAPSALIWHASWKTHPDTASRGKTARRRGLWFHTQHIQHNLNHSILGRQPIN